MPQTININASGQSTINFGGTAVLVDIGGPVLPSDAGAILQDIYDDMSARGLSEVHLERNDSHSFRHDVKAGVVTETSLTPLEDFDAVMGAEAEILAALSPASEPEPVL